jgi:hypothetical protein
MSHVGHFPIAGEGVTNLGQRQATAKDIGSSFPLLQLKHLVKISAMLYFKFF